MASPQQLSEGTFFISKCKMSPWQSLGRTLVSLRQFSYLTVVKAFFLNSSPPIAAYMHQVSIGSDNGLLPGWCQAIIITNAGMLLIRSLGTNFSEILIKIHAFSFKKIHLKRSSGKWQPFFLSLNVLKHFFKWILFYKEHFQEFYSQWVLGPDSI